MLQKKKFGETRKERLLIPLKITIYGVPRCPSCSAVKKWLEEQSIACAYVDASKEMDDWFNSHGFSSVPVIRFDDDTFLVGFQVDALKDKLGI